MVYSGLLIEFSDVLLSELNCFSGLFDTKKQELGDALNATINIYQQKRMLPDFETKGHDRMWSSFICFLIKISQDNPEIRLDFMNFMEIFFEVYNKNNSEKDEKIADEAIRKILMLQR